MLIRFVVENFLSFSEESEFNMLVGNFKTHKKHINNGVVKTLRAAAIYGANGAGKSNIVKGIEFLQDAVKEGGINRSVNSYKFRLNEEFKERPVSFELELGIDDKVYAYGVRFNNIQVVEEWLFESGITKEDKLIFSRELTKTGVTAIQVANKYQKTNEQKLLLKLLRDNLLKNNELLLCKDGLLKINELSDVKDKIIEDIIVIHPQTKFAALVPNIVMSDEFKYFANSLLKTFDTGVGGLAIESVELGKYLGEDDEELKEELITELQNGQSVLLNHKGRGVLVTSENDKYEVKRVVANHFDNKGNVVPFELEDESDGTQRLLDFMPALNGILSSDVTFIIDEIDQSLHPALLKSLITKVMSEVDVKGQLVFTTHEANLLDLDIFRQDEIWFVEKDRQKGNSNIYSLSEFKPRYDLDIRKGYLKGRFGAIPFMAHLEDLNWNRDEEA